MIGLIVAFALALSLALAAIGNSWTATASADFPAESDVVAEDDLDLAGPSWTWVRVELLPFDTLGTSWS
ncbi:MAG: hypothetical protein GY926_13895 [bacterium]|nr:hypothetical protein [bacterium]MCP4966310.1 hypothetical protein [bacterium]